MSFLKNYWGIIVAYLIVIIGVVYSWTCTFSCEELGCLGCIIMGMFALYISALFSTVMIGIAFSRDRAEMRLWWYAPIIIFAAGILLFAGLN